MSTSEHGGDILKLFLQIEELARENEEVTNKLPVSFQVKARM